MKKVKYFSAADFKKYMCSMGFPSYTYNHFIISIDEIEKCDFAVISIGNVEECLETNNDVDLWANGCSNHWFPNCRNILNVNFNDVGEGEDCAISSKQAKDIVNFIEDNKNKNSFFIHCGAGISRSGAIASIIYDYLRLEDEIKIEPIYPMTPNYYVRNMLKRELNKR